MHTDKNIESMSKILPGNSKIASEGLSIKHRVAVLETNLLIAYYSEVISHLQRLINTQVVGKPNEATDVLL